MKKTVLFVDDEEMVLQGLQRSMRAMRNDWDMTFVDSGAKALAFLEKTPVDVVVSDMRMPGMNGAQLFAEVAKRFPKSVRLILSGHADQELILQCVGSTHQFLSKPCDPEALRATVRRAMELEGSVKNAHLQQLVARMDHLPSVPSLYSEIIEKMNDPEAALEDVGVIIAKDPGMTAKILKLVNSAFFGLRREVSNPTDAVSFLGLDTIKSLVLSLNAFSQYESVKTDGFSLSALWNHSLSTAAAAKRIAQLEKADLKIVDQAFVAGLLHDAGKTVLAFNFPDQYGKTIQAAQAQGADPLGAEHEAFGANHADVGGYLLGLWGLPVPVVDAIALHHQPKHSADAAFTPLTAVHAANALVKAEGGTLPAWDSDYLCRLSLGDHATVWQKELCAGTITTN
ncbi:MAG: HDOD domain-containing protein [Verrucomicrobia bacterium]|nr:HDOD domain-containing protein [Verrucomicrobiota bacterium]